MDIAELNDLDAPRAYAAVRPCADIPRWVEAVVDERPYTDVDALASVAGRLAGEWTRAEVRRALSDHPRIGERHAGTGASSAMSQCEQAGVVAGPDVQIRLAEGNRAYERRFGRVFLVRAAGRDAGEILALLEERLGHDEETEWAVTAAELREIALLRLRRVFS